MKQIAVLLGIGLIFAAARLGWVWWVRHDAHIRMEETSQARRERAYASPPNAGNGVEITQFYARSGAMTEDDPNLVCYGVRNARSVRVEPPVEELTPAENRCFFIEPHQDTTYTLLAEGSDSRQVSASFRVLVKPAPPAILMFTTSETKIPRGEAVTLCYGVAHASSVRMEPGGWQLPTTTKNCTRFYPKTTGTYTLVASGVGGTSRKAFSVTVQ